MAETQSKPAGAQVPAIFTEPRIAYHPAIADKFGIDKGLWRVLVEAVWPAAKTADGIALALSYCKARNLDPLKRPVHIVPIYSKSLKREVESVWPGISELRTTAMRTNAYAGCDPTSFGPIIKHTFKGKSGGYDNEPEKAVEVTVEFPEWAQITVYRIVQNQRVAFPGPKVFWIETYATRGFFSELPNDMWTDRKSGQLEKCAEAAALRKAFPEELGGDLAAEEMWGKVIEGTAVELPTQPTPARPERQIEAETKPKETAARREPKPKPEPAKATETPGAKAEEKGAKAAAAEPAAKPEITETLPDSLKEWLGDWYDLLNRATMERTVDDLQDDAERELKDFPEDKQRATNACNEKVRALKKAKK